MQQRICSFHIILGACKLQRTEEWNSLSVSRPQVIWFSGQELGITRCWVHRKSYSQVLVRLFCCSLPQHWSTANLMRSLPHRCKISSISVFMAWTSKISSEKQPTRMYNGLNKTKNPADLPNQTLQCQGLKFMRLALKNKEKDNTWQLPWQTSWANHSFTAQIQKH